MYGEFERDWWVLAEEVSRIVCAGEWLEEYGRYVMRGRWHC